MNKLSKIFCAIIAILIIALSIISYKFFTLRKKFNSLGEELMELVEMEDSDVEE